MLVSRSGSLVNGRDRSVSRSSSRRCCCWWCVRGNVQCKARVLVTQIVHELYVLPAKGFHGYAERQRVAVYIGGFPPQACNMHLPEMPVDVETDLCTAAVVIFDANDGDE